MNKQMTYEEEQQQIKEYANLTNPKGIFYVPNLDTYSATILISNTHKIHVVDETTGPDGVYANHIEHGSLSYIIGEVMHAYNHRQVGLIYPYNIVGNRSHDHSFEGVIQACQEYLSFEIKEEDKQYYSMQELEILDDIMDWYMINPPAFPYKLNNTEDVVYGFENLLKIVVNNHGEFTPTDTDYYYNTNQLEIINSIIEYQTYEHNK